MLVGSRNVLWKRHKTQFPLPKKKKILLFRTCLCFIRRRFIVLNSKQKQNNNFDSIQIGLPKVLKSTNSLLFCHRFKRNFLSLIRNWRRKIVFVNYLVVGNVTRFEQALRVSRYGNLRGFSMFMRCKFKDYRFKTREDVCNFEENITSCKVFK